jgi:hypothetical protein
LNAESKRLFAIISEVQATLRSLHRLDRAKAPEAMPVEHQRAN